MKECGSLGGWAARLRDCLREKHRVTRREHRERQRYRGRHALSMYLGATQLGTKEEMKVEDMS